MGVNPTLPNYKSFTFDGTNSRTYGVYITGQGVFNAPERNVEMVEIPGRNGAYALDKGNFNNIEITYPAGIFADTEADFATAVSDLRNFLCFKEGYVRLEDDYNSGEYRLAIYKSGLEVEHDGLINGEFEITFECKPQRFLTSGETAVAVASGGTLTNPTLFPSRPQLQIWGYGNFTVNGEALEIISTAIGTVILAEAETYSLNTTQTIEFDDTYANTGDLITFGSNSITINRDLIVVTNNNYDTSGFSNVSVSYSGNGTATASLKENNREVQARVLPSVSTEFVYGTSETRAVSANYTCTTVKYGNKTVTINGQIAYDGANTFTISSTVSLPTNIKYRNFYNYHSTITLDSTQSALGSPIYFDLDIGEAYKIENGSIVSVNSAVTIPSNLPTLASGTNTFTYDNTITQFKVVPRWWKV